MAETIYIAEGTKEEQYLSVLPQLEALIRGETDRIANMANACALLKAQFNWLWVGFYIVRGSELVLGPFQGPIACTRIKCSQGVCGAAWRNNTTIVVKDVETFPGHIACSSLSKSEIVIPFHIDDVVCGVLDVDSSELAHFDETDVMYLEKFVKILFAS